MQIVNADIFDFVKVFVPSYGKNEKWAIYLGHNGNIDLLHKFEKQLEGLNGPVDQMKKHVMQFHESNFLFFDTKEEMDKIFDILCEHPYYGNDLFAISVKPDGTIISENT